MPSKSHPVFSGWLFFLQSKKIITDFHEQPIQDRVRRDIEIPLDSGKIVSLIGVRRSGKTSILFHFINRLKTEVDPARIVYINFEDDRLFPLKLHQLDDLMKTLLFCT